MLVKEAVSLSLTKRLSSLYLSSPSLSTVSRSKPTIMTGRALAANGSGSRTLTYQHVFPMINIFISPLPSCLSSSLIYYFLTTPYPFPTSSSLLLTPPSTTASPCCVAKQVSSRAGLMTGGSELAKSTGPEPEQRSWAAHAQISPSSE